MFANAFTHDEYANTHDEYANQSVIPALPSESHTLAAVLALPGLNPFAGRPAGQQQSDDRIDPTPSERGGGGQSGQDGPAWAAQIRFCRPSPLVAPESSRLPRRRLATPRIGITIRLPAVTVMPRMLSPA
jgi:hypothetical protein